MSKELRSEPKGAQFDAVAALAELGPPAAPVLAEALQWGDAPLALAALRELVYLAVPEPAALAKLDRLRESPHPELRREALVALLLLDRARRSQHLETVLGELESARDPRGWPQRLAELGPLCVPVLEAALADSKASTRRLALLIVAELIEDNEDPSSWNAPAFQADITRFLERAQQDTDPDLSRAAKKLLEFYKRSLQRQFIPVVG